MPTLQSPANVIAVGYSANQIISACGDGILRHWDPKSATPIKIVPTDNARYRQLMIFRDGRLLAGVASDGKIKIWDTDCAVLLHKLAWPLCHRRKPCFLSRL